MAQVVCRETSGDPRSESPVFLTCMQGKGWAMHGLGLAAEPATVGGDEAVATAGPNPGCIPAHTDAASPPAQPGPTPAQALQHSGVAGKTQLVISSWWKLGAAPDDIEKAERRYASQPGVNYRQDPGSDVVIGEMYACLRGQGWYGVEKQKSQLVNWSPSARGARPV